MALSANVLLIAATELSQRRQETATDRMLASGMRADRSEHLMESTRNDWEYYFLLTHQNMITFYCFIYLPLIWKTNIIYAELYFCNSNTNIKSCGLATTLIQCKT